MAALKLPGLPFVLSPEGAPPPRCRILNGTLVLTAAGGTDMFIDPGAGPAPDAEELPDAGRLMGLPPAGDFTLAAQVNVAFASMYDAGVLLVHAAERLWAKLCFEYSPQLTPTAVTVVTRDTSDDSNSFEVNGDTLWLRVTRSGDAWAFHASADGSWWRLLRYFALGPLGAGELVRVGFLAQSPTGEGCAVTFDHIAFSPGAPANLRDGSLSWGVKQCFLGGGNHTPQTPRPSCGCSPLASPGREALRTPAAGRPREMLASLAAGASVFWGVETTPPTPPQTPGHPAVARR